MVTRNYVRVFDTTLRDGEQAPGFSLTHREKLLMAKQLQKLNVDIIEAGFPIASTGDFESAKLIAENIEGPYIAGLARANQKDIKCAWDAVKYSKKPYIHTFIATSEIHMREKLRKTPAEVLKDAIAAVRYAKGFTENVEFSPEDASRSDPKFLAEVVEAAIAEGAIAINIPDTVGYSMPHEFGGLIRYLKENVPNIDKAILSVHCHNDLGLAVANSLEAIKNGARQVHCTINGIGERAGNASLEEVAMGLYVRQNIMPFKTNIDTKLIYPTSQLLSRLTGQHVQLNKAIVGGNAFSHEAGIHQAGVISNPLTYEIMTPETVGQPGTKIVVGKHSGKAGAKYIMDLILEEFKGMGYKLTDEDVKTVSKGIKDLADKKKNITIEDVRVIMENQVLKTEEYFKFVDCKYNSKPGNGAIGQIWFEMNGEPKYGEAKGDGPIDALFNAIEKETGISVNLLQYSTNSIGRGHDAIGEATVRLEISEKEHSGAAAHTDTIRASAMAYFATLNRWHRKTENNNTSQKL